jgi:RimJ/RimL family protein N-acetyltransferase
MEIKFKNYQIRSWRAEDAASLQKYADNRKIWLNLRDIFPHPYTCTDAQRWIDFVLSQEPECNFAIATASEAIGGIGLVFGEDVHCLTAELGYWLGEPFWRRGIMSGAVSCFTDFAFLNYRLQRIFAAPFVGNLASRRVLEKAGFLPEGIMRNSVLKDGCILDQVLYAVICE